MGSSRKQAGANRYVTIRDIAVKAGVSANTVSRALNDKDDIGRETKEKVRNIARELGYIRHAAASGLRSGATRSIGIVLTHIDNEFFSRILQGINDRLAEKDYTILMLASNEDPEAERRNLDTLAAYRVSGILYIPASDLLGEAGRATIQAPHIEIVRHLPNAKGGYFVADSARSGSLAATYLISKGRRRLAYLGFDRPVSCNRDRLRGYMREAESAGLGMGPGDARVCEASAESAFMAMRAWLADGFDYDGLFVYNDVMAFGAIRALADGKRRIPRDVSVVGHDDIETAEAFIPRLTTIHVPKYELGYDSASALLDLIEGRRAAIAASHRVYEPELIARET